VFQLVAGLRYAFPHAMARLEPRFPRIAALHGCIAARPRIAAYLKSARRIAFNEHGIFRHYPELDAAAQPTPGVAHTRRYVGECLHDPARSAANLYLMWVNARERCSLMMA